MKYLKSTQVFVVQRMFMLQRWQKIRIIKSNCSLRDFVFYPKKEINTQSQ